MSGITRTAYAALTAHAADLLTQAGGVEKLDSLSVRIAASTLVDLTHALKDAEGCTYKTARQHIARACRRARDPNFTPPKWGGDRSKNPA